MDERSSSGDGVQATCEIPSLSRETCHMRGSWFSLQENPHATLTMSLAQTNFCRKHGFDPQSPLCAHIILSGTVTKVGSYPPEQRLVLEVHHLINTERTDILKIQ